MDDVACGESATSRDHALAGRDRTLRHRLALDVVAAAALDCAGDARAHPEVIVGRVDDGRRFLGGDIAFDNVNFEHQLSACLNATTRTRTHEERTNKPLLL